MVTATASSENEFIYNKISMADSNNPQVRLRAFNEHEQRNAVKWASNADMEDKNRANSTALPSPQILDGKKVSKVLAEEEVKLDEKGSTQMSNPVTPLTISTKKEVDMKSDKDLQQLDAHGRDVVNRSGIGGSVSTLWENMKRLMGFAPECLNGGYRGIGSRSCTCPQYFEGHFCERIVCVNGGARVRVAAFGGEEVCKCSHPDYISGKHCEQVHCQNGGRLLNDGTCHCVDGWYSGQFCQFYTSSWLIAIGVPLLFIALIIACCVICRMDLCALRRSQISGTRARSANRRSNGRRHHQQPHQNCATRPGANRHRREQIPFRQRDEDMVLARGGNPHQQFCIQQNLLNDQQQQYVLRLEQVPVYNPRLYVPADKPLEPPPSYEQAILCPPANSDPPNYHPQPIATDNHGEQNGSNGITVEHTDTQHQLSNREDNPGEQPSI